MAGMDPAGARTGAGLAGHSGQPAEDYTSAGDAELVDAATAGDGEAFAELYSRHYMTTVMHLMGRGALREDAADAAQDAFIEALRKLDQLEDRARFSGWVRRAAERKQSSAQRRRLRQLTMAPEAFHAVVDLDGRGPEELALVQDAKEQLLATVNLLSARQRETVLYRLAGLPDEEISRRLGVSHGTLSAYFARALATLCRLLPDPDPPTASRTPAPAADVVHRLVPTPPEPPEPEAPTTRRRPMVALPTRQRQVWELSELGLSPHQIAGQLGITCGAARASLCLARKRLVSE